MQPISRLLAISILASLWHVSQIELAFAGLNPPPKSHVLPLADGRHMIVFLSPVPEQEDEGKIATLPNGKKVDLRATFPASSCYEVGSTHPVWTASWDDTVGWAVSTDGRFLVRWNGHGMGTFDGWNGELSWMLKFYDQGREIKSYNTAELIDYPQLVPFDDRYCLFGDTEGNLTIKGNIFSFDTSTHDRYRFDIHTGEILQQFHPWRIVSRIAWGVLALLFTASAVLFWRWRNSAARYQPRELETPIADIRRRNILSRRPGFSLRGIALIAIAVAVITTFLIRCRAVVCLFAVFLIASLVTRAAILNRHKIGFSGCSVLVSFVWLAAYVLSASPINAILNWLDAPDDVRYAIMFTVYRPLIWIHITWPGVNLLPEWWAALSGNS